MIRLKVVSLSIVILFIVYGAAFAGGPFGSLQPVSKETGGLHTGIGYWYHEDKFGNGTEHVIRQNQVYSEVAYGAGNSWDIYGRIGISNLKILDAFSTAQPVTTSSKSDFEESWKFFGTLGAKGFYPFNKTFGMGAFVQGTYYFRDLEDQVSGTQGGTPYTIELDIKKLWDVNFGIGFQAAVPFDARLYIGPYLYYAEAKASPSANIPGLNLTAGDATIKNKTNIGGFAGIDVPLGKGFRLNVEGQYSERLSAGAAVTYVY
jgi:hypothetical protein